MSQHFELNFKHSQNQLGFTLVEVLVAMALLGIILSASYTVLSSGTSFASRQTTQVENRNDARQVLVEIVKNIQEGDPNKIGDYQTFMNHYVKHGFLTSASLVLDDVNNIATSPEINIIKQDGQKISYRFNAEDNTIYRKIDFGQEQAFIKNVVDFLITFHQNNQVYQIDVTIFNDGETFILPLSAVPRVKYRIVTSVSISGTPVIVIPEPDEENIVTDGYNYVATVNDQFGSAMSGEEVTWELYTSIENGISLTGNGNSALVEVSSEAVEGSFILAASSNTRNGEVEGFMLILLTGSGDNGGGEGNLWYPYLNLNVADELYQLFADSTSRNNLNSNSSLKYIAANQTLHGLPKGQFKYNDVNQLKEGLREFFVPEHETWKGYVQGLNVSQMEEFIENITGKSYNSLTYYQTLYGTDGRYIVLKGTIKIDAREGKYYYQLPGIEKVQYP